MLRKILISTALLGCTAGANAKDVAHYFDFNQAVENAIADGTIDGTVKFYLSGTDNGGEVVKSGLITNRKTNGFAKSAKKSCDWALRSALIQFDQAAKAEGANAVTNIVSFYKGNEFNDGQNYECYKGFAVAAVTLKADIVKY